MISHESEDTFLANSTNAPMHQPKEVQTKENVKDLSSTETIVFNVDKSCSSNNNSQVLNQILEKEDSERETADFNLCTETENETENVNEELDESYDDKKNGQDLVRQNKQDDDGEKENQSFLVRGPSKKAPDLQPLL